MKYTVHCYHYGQEYKEQFDSLEDALYYASKDIDHWVDKIVDEDGNVVVEFKYYTAFYEGEDTGEKCRFCQSPIKAKAFPIALAGGRRVIGYVCWTCLGAAYRGEDDD